jgi:L-rhamnonate dehydratase
MSVEHLSYVKCLLTNGLLYMQDFDGHALLKRAHPTVKFTTGEHEFSRYGMRKLMEGRNIDIIQPDVMWVGGLTELLKISAMAAAYDIPVVPHASGPYSYHFVVSQTNCPFQEYLANSADGKSVLPVFGNLFSNEPIPTHVSSLYRSTRFDDLTYETGLP